MNRPHLHPLYDVAELTVRDPARGERWSMIGSPSSGLTRRQRVRLGASVGRFVLERQSHTRRALGLARLDWLLTVLDGGEPDSFEPRGEVPPVVEQVLHLVGQENGYGLDDGLLYLIRWAARGVGDGETFLRFLSGELVRGELASLGVRFSHAGELAGSTPVFRAIRVWLHRAPGGGLLLLRLEDQQTIFVDGSDEHVLASLPDEHFATVVGLLR